MLPTTGLPVLSGWEVWMEETLNVSIVAAFAVVIKSVIEANVVEDVVVVVAVVVVAAADGDGNEDGSVLNWLREVESSCVFDKVDGLID